MSLVVKKELWVGTKNIGAASAVNNTVNKLVLGRRSCEKLHKKFRFTPDPVFITSGIYIAVFKFHWLLMIMYAE